MIYIILIIHVVVLILSSEILKIVNMKIFVINGGQIFGHSGGKFNKTIFDTTIDFFGKQDGFEIQSTDVNDAYDVVEEVKKYVWADVVIYHTPIWWFQLPHGFKKYIDEVFTEGYQ